MTAPKASDIKAPTPSVKSSAAKPAGKAAASEGARPPLAKLGFATVDDNHRFPILNNDSLPH
jgi:hypothetical protein